MGVQIDLATVLVASTPTGRVGYILLYLLAFPFAVTAADWVIKRAPSPVALAVAAVGWVRRRGRSENPDVVVGPLRGWKVAYLLATTDKRGDLTVCCAGVTAADIYRARGNARCGHSDHPAPQRWCTCGFYAFADRRRAGRALHKGLVTLEVSLDGRVVEHGHGYRAQRQTVDAVVAGRDCVRCSGPARVLAGLQPAATRNVRRRRAAARGDISAAWSLSHVSPDPHADLRSEWVTLEPHCRSCAAVIGATFALTPAEVASALKTEVRLG